MKKQKDENKVGYQTVSLPVPLINKIKKKMKGTGIPSVSAYVAFVLREILSSSTYTEKDVIEIRKRLKNLNYL